MLREPRMTEKSIEPRKDPRSGRFQVVKLEERIAPTAHTNPQGNPVGNDGGGHHVIKV